MKTIAVSMNDKELQELLEQAKKENLILRTPDGMEFVLAEIDDFDREIELTRQNEELMALLESRAGQTVTVSLSQVKTDLGLN
jgi:hypothetical protein